jgi:hypothetical protein
MRKLFVFAAVICIASCVTVKMYKTEALKMRLSYANTFLIKKDGEKMIANKITEYYNKNTNEFGLNVDGKIILDRFVEAYQDSKAYYGRFDSGWVEQMRRGKINLYYYESFISGEENQPNGGYYDHFIFQKGNSLLKESSKYEIGEMLKDNSAALNQFNDEFKRGDKYIPRQMKLSEISAIVDTYNQ